MLEQLHVQVLRMTLNWGGRGGVATRRPALATDPADPAYDWARYDQAIERANDAGIQVLLTIVGTPAWANGGHGPRAAAELGEPTCAGSPTRPPAATAARSSTSRAAACCRASGLWLAWNEPNNPVFLQPQYVRVRGKWRPAAPSAYARICNAIYAGVHAAGGPEQVACGATAPRGSNDPTSDRPSISPIAFLRAAKRSGLRHFDAWAHHPYYGCPARRRRRRKVGPRAVELGNIDTLVDQVTRLYGRKPLWITEYGYQTKPPDEFFGVSWAKQAQYLRQAYEIARANPRIDLFTWFLLDDSADPDGWQSGLITADGRKKPAFAVFEHLRDGSL